MRLFIAVKLSSAIIGRLRSIVSDLKPRLPRARWINPDDAHMTLVFLGEVPENNVALIRQAMKEAVREQYVFSLALGGLGAFPSWENPRVVWLGVAQGAENLQRIEASLRDKLSESKFHLEARSYHPHVTLCRRQPEEILPAFRDEAERLADPSAWSSAAMRVDSIELIQSRLTRSGAVHAIIGTEPLRGRGRP